MDLGNGKLCDTDHLTVLRPAGVQSNEPVVWPDRVELLCHHSLVELDRLVEAAQLLEVLPPQESPYVLDVVQFSLLQTLTTL